MRANVSDRRQPFGRLADGFRTRMLGRPTAKGLEPSARRRYSLASGRGRFLKIHAIPMLIP